eukprot:GDKI01013243.1.p1 GENE.GDKI01013243.1~~GDKI01013243.1.p1  ORF type:complete len:270 (-),score=53.53 GDKI01013243.1:294-1103(-)
MPTTNDADDVGGLGDIPLAHTHAYVWKLPLAWECCLLSYYGIPGWGETGHLHSFRVLEHKKGLRGSVLDMLHERRWFATLRKLIHLEDKVDGQIGGHAYANFFKTVYADKIEQMVSDFDRLLYIPRSLGDHIFTQELLKLIARNVPWPGTVFEDKKKRVHMVKHFIKQGGAIVTGHAHVVAATMSTTGTARQFDQQGFVALDSLETAAPPSSLSVAAITREQVGAAVQPRHGSLHPYKPIAGCAAGRFAALVSGARIQGLAAGRRCVPT